MRAKEGEKEEEEERRVPEGIMVLIRGDTRGE